MKKCCFIGHRDIVGIEKEIYSSIDDAARVRRAEQGLATLSAILIAKVTFPAG